jgi:hypothetical protein
MASTAYMDMRSALDQLGLVLCLAAVAILSGFTPGNFVDSFAARGAMACPLFVAASFYKGFTAQLHLADN